jgi:hypothetical protein
MAVQLLFVNLMEYDTLKSHLLHPARDFARSVCGVTSSICLSGGLTINNQAWTVVTTSP